MCARLQRTLAMVPLIGALASGCGRDASESKTSAATSEAEVAGFDPNAGAIAEMPDQPTAVKLIDAGAEPRELLRHGAFGSSRQIEVGLTMFFNHEPRPFMTVAMSWAGASTGAEDFGYRWAVTKAKSDFGDDASDMEDEVGRSLETMFEALRGQATGDGTGLTRVIQTKGMTASPSPVALLYTFAVPLPDAAVGVGASWERTTDPNLATDPEGPELRKLVSPSKRVADEDELVKIERFTLAERQGDVLTIDYAMTLKVRGDEEPAQKASGRFVVALGDPLAQAGSVDISSVELFPADEDEEATRFELSQRISLTSVE